MAGTVSIPTPAPPPSSAPEPERIVVDVVGAVVRPGVHELPAPSRVADAVDAAGGFTADADRIRLNLAEPLIDGSRVWVPAVGESSGPELVPIITGSGGGTAAGGGSGGGSQSVDINTADAAALETLPGVGPSLAEAIVEHRRRAGPFASVDELVEISAWIHRRACGIGGWGRVAAGLVRVCGPARFGACRIGVWGWCGLVAGGVRLRCAGRCGRLRGVGAGCGFVAGRW